MVNKNMLNHPLPPEDCKLFVAKETFYCFVPITKVSSTFLRRALNGDNFDIHQWKMHATGDVGPDREDVRFLVVLRDPVKRWVSGIVENFCRAYPDRDWSINDNYDWLFDKIEFDIHTVPQYKFLDVIDHAKTDWLWIPDSGIETHPWFTDNDVILSSVEDDDRNFGHSRPLVWFVGEERFNEPQDGAVSSVPSSIIYNTLTQLIADQPARAKVVRDYYKGDYDLIQSVTFYGNVKP